MTGSRSIFRRAYDGAALFALLNMVALVCVVGYLAATGAVDGEKVRRAAIALRGETAPIPEPPAGDGNALLAVAKPDMATGIESEVDLEIAHRESERIKTELDQRLALNNSILLKVRTEREAYRRERDAAAKQEQAFADVQREDGFRKQVAIMEALSPKVAIQHLLAISDPTEAAGILMTMETGKAKKIVEAAKRGEDLNRMKLILQRVRETAPSQLAGLDHEEE